MAELSRRFEHGAHPVRGGEVRRRAFDASALLPQGNGTDSDAQREVARHDVGDALGATGRERARGGGGRGQARGVVTGQRGTWARATEHRGTQRDRRIARRLRDQPRRHAARRHVQQRQGPVNLDRIQVREITGRRRRLVVAGPGAAARSH